MFNTWLERIFQFHFVNVLPKTCFSWTSSWNASSTRFFRLRGQCASHFQCQNVDNVLCFLYFFHKNDKSKSEFFKTTANFKKVQLQLRIKTETTTL